MAYDTKTLLSVIIGLGVGLFYLDLYLPSGISTGVLYGGLVILSFLLPYRKGPLIAAAVCSVLDLAGTDLGLTIAGVPHWMSVVNRLFSLTALWLPLLFFLHRRRAEEELRHAHDELEARVQARTQQLATLNQSLITEIADRKETEQSLRCQRSHAASQGTATSAESRRVASAGRAASDGAGRRSSEDLP